MFQRNFGACKLVLNLQNFCKIQAGNVNSYFEVSPAACERRSRQFEKQKWTAKRSAMSCSFWFKFNLSLLTDVRINEPDWPKQTNWIHLAPSFLTCLFASHCSAFLKSYQIKKRRRLSGVCCSEKKTFWKLFASKVWNHSHLILLAGFGCLWAHVWTFFSQVALKIPFQQSFHVSESSWSENWLKYYFFQKQCAGFKIYTHHPTGVNCCKILWVYCAVFEMILWKVFIWKTFEPSSRVQEKLELRILECSVSISTRVKIVSNHGSFKYAKHSLNQELWTCVEKSFTCLSSGLFSNRHCFSCFSNAAFVESGFLRHRVGSTVFPVALSYSLWSEFMQMQGLHGRKVNIERQWIFCTNQTFELVWPAKIMTPKLLCMRAAFHAHRSVMCSNILACVTAVHL